MTEWYSPKEKLPRIDWGAQSLDVYTITLKNDGQRFFQACR